MLDSSSVTPASNNPGSPQPAGRARAALAQLWRQAGLPAEALARVSLSGAEPGVPSSFAVGSALQAAQAAAALAATECGRLAGGLTQDVSVHLPDVLRESACHFKLDGKTLSIWDKLSGLYPCGGEAPGGAQPGHVRIHANFAHHRDGALALLGLPTGPQTEREQVRQALRNWPAEAFETSAAERGLVVAAVRSPQAWAQHPQALAVAQLPLVDIQPIDGGAGTVASPKQRLDGAEDPRPLAGLRVLELTRILAGPVAGRTLAAYGADVLLVNSPNLPNIESIAETSRGKLSTHIDLKTEAGRETLRGLVRECDIFLQGYRPGGLQALGFGPQDLARLRPGIVCVELSAYGPTGPWATRRGFDSLVQSATGLNWAEAQAFGSAEPRALPLQALDYGAGYLLAFGALAALCRQRSQGGSWQVRVSLAGVGQWLNSLGRVADGPNAPALNFEGALEESSSGFGTLAAVPHAARLSHSSTAWSRPSMPPGSHAPVWPRSPEQYAAVMQDIKGRFELGGKLSREQMNER